MGSISGARRRPLGWPPAPTLGASDWFPHSSYEKEPAQKRGRLAAASPHPPPARVQTIANAARLFMAVNPAVKRKVWTSGTKGIEAGPVNFRSVDASVDHAGKRHFCTLAGRLRAGLRAIFKR